MIKPFDYCPACATLLESPDGEGGAACPNCGRTWYRNSAPTAGAAIVKEGKALVTVRAGEPMKGRLDVPGGFLRPGEEPLDGLRREVEEELGVELDVTYDDFVQAIPHTYGDEGDYVLSLGFRARIASGEPHPGDDVADIRWVTLEDLEDLDFAWTHDRDLIRSALTKEEEER